MLKYFLALILFFLPLSSFGQSLGDSSHVVPLNETFQVTDFDPGGAYTVRKVFLHTGGDSCIAPIDLNTIGPISFTSSLGSCVATGDDIRGDTMGLSSWFITNDGGVDFYSWDWVPPSTSSTSSSQDQVQENIWHAILAFSGAMVFIIWFLRKK